jgi:DNA-directed RNA polymerase II subunit RPB2
VDISPSRVIRPLLIVDEESQELMIDKLNMRGRSNYELLVSGCLEFLSPWEQEYIKLATSEGKIKGRLQQIDSAEQTYQEAINLEIAVNDSENGTILYKDVIVDLKEAQSRTKLAKEDLDKARNKRAYTHCEIDPLDTIDVSASLIPWPDHNQAPRNTYQVSMGNQALGTYHSNHLNRMNDGKTKTLAFANRPMVETDMYSVIGLDEKPAGENVNYSFLAFPYTEEDAFIVKKEFLDNGGMRMYKYLTYKTVINEDNPDVEEKLAFPDVEERYKYKYKYIHPNRDSKGNVSPMAGLPKIGAPLRTEDCIIGKVQRSRKNPKEPPRNESVMLRVGDDGVVEKVLVTSNNKKTTVIVKLRVMRIPEEGDKYAPRNAQKGTIGLVMSDIDLPFGKSGITPDFIGNSHALPSRMTVAYPFELHASKAGAMKGVHVNGGAFNDYMMDEHRNILKQYGMHEFGYEEMRSGTTAELLEELVFSGPVFFQALRHHVKDKVQSRGTGPVNAATRSPMKGRGQLLGLSGG